MGIFRGRKALAAVKVGLVLASVVAVAGCTTSRSIELEYWAGPKPVLAQVPHGSIYVAPFEDLRAEGEIVGNVSHGLFESAVHPDTKVRIRQGSVGTWVRDALVSELELRGYDVLDADEGSAWQINGVVHELFYREGGWPFPARPSARMTIECQIVRDRQVTSSEMYSARAAAKGPGGRPGDPVHLLATVLRRALQEFIEDLEAVRLDVAEKD